MGFTKEVPRNGIFLLTMGLHLQHRKTGYQLWTPEGYLIMLPDECVEDLKDVHDSFADNTALAKVSGDQSQMLHQITPPKDLLGRARA